MSDHNKLEYILRSAKRLARPEEAFDGKVQVFISGDVKIHIAPERGQPHEPATPDDGDAKPVKKPDPQP